MAPAAHHRLAHPTVVSQAWIRHAGRDIACAMAALMLAIGLDVHLVAIMILNDRVMAVSLGAGASGLLGWLWFARPWFTRRRNGDGDAASTSASVTPEGAPRPRPRADSRANRIRGPREERCAAIPPPDLQRPAARLVHVSDATPGIRPVASGPPVPLRPTRGQPLRDAGRCNASRGWRFRLRTKRLDLRATRGPSAGNRTRRARPQTVSLSSGVAQFATARNSGGCPTSPTRCRGFGAGCAPTSRGRDLPREKVLAVVVSLLDATRARVGNAEYARDNGSFGLATLRSHHVRFVPDGTLVLRFRGKGGVPHAVAVDDKRLARIVRRCHELPGQPLFQYVDEARALRPIDSGQVNLYLKDAMGDGLHGEGFPHVGARPCARWRLMHDHAAARGAERTRAATAASPRRSGPSPRNSRTRRRSVASPMSIRSCSTRGAAERCIARWARGQPPTASPSGSLRRVFAGAPPQDGLAPAAAIAVLRRRPHPSRRQGTAVQTLADWSHKGADASIRPNMNPREGGRAGSGCPRAGTGGTHATSDTSSSRRRRRRPSRRRTAHHISRARPCSPRPSCLPWRPARIAATFSVALASTLAFVSAALASLMQTSLSLPVFASHLAFATS